MKKILAFFLLIITMIGVSGCMSNKGTEYKAEILSYLEDKYDEEFEVLKIKRQIEAGTPDTVIALCKSDRYPKEEFELNYILSSDDIYNKEEIEKFLYDNGIVTEGDKKKNIEESEPYFLDDYVNVIKQHEFDDSIELPNGTKMVTRILTPNFYPKEDDKILSALNYVTEERIGAFCYHYVFVFDESVSDDDIIQSLVDKSIPRQYVSIIRTERESEECLELYYDNYKFPYEIYAKDEMTRAIQMKEYKYGEQVS